MIATLFELAEIIDNYVEGGASFSDSTTLHKMTVPSGRRWRFYGGLLNRDVSSTCNIILYNENNKLLAYLGSLSAGTGVVNYLATTASNAIIQKGQYFPMKAGWYVAFEFGTAQSTAAYMSGIAKEVVL